MTKLLFSFLLLTSLTALANDLFQSNGHGPLTLTRSSDSSYFQQLLALHEGGTALTEEDARGHIVSEADGLAGIAISAESPNRPKWMRVYCRVFVSFTYPDLGPIFTQPEDEEKLECGLSTSQYYSYYANEMVSVDGEFCYNTTSYYYGTGTSNRVCFRLADSGYVTFKKDAVHEDADYEVLEVGYFWKAEAEDASSEEVSDEDVASSDS